MVPSSSSFSSSVSFLFLFVCLSERAHTAAAPPPRRVVAADSFRSFLRRAAASNKVGFYLHPQFNVIVLLHLVAETGPAAHPDTAAACFCLFLFFSFFSASFMFLSALAADERSRQLPVKVHSYRPSASHDPQADLRTKREVSPSSSFVFLKSSFRRVIRLFVSPSADVRRAAAQQRQHVRPLLGQRHERCVGSVPRQQCIPPQQHQLHVHPIRAARGAAQVSPRWSFITSRSMILSLHDNLCLFLHAARPSHT